MHMVDRKIMDKNSEKNMQFFHLYNSIHIRIFSFLLILVHNRTDAEELLQETATVLWEKFDTFREGTNFGAWAIQIAKNKAFEFLRNNQKTRMIFENYIYEDISNVAEKRATEIDTANRIRALEQCLAILGNQPRKLLTLRYQKNFTVKKISEMIGRSQFGLYQTYTRIIKSLRSCIFSKLEKMEL